MKSPGESSSPRAAKRLSRRPPPVVVSVGGSVLFTGDRDAAFIRDLADLVHRLSADISLVITTGGGRTAREYIDIGRTLGLTQVELDELGIEVTRLHARLLAARVGAPAPAVPPTTIARAVDEAHRTSVVILGGTEPGHTTDAVAALLAVRLRAPRLINATSVDGLYDHDPRREAGARRIERIGWTQFREIVHFSTAGDPGQEFVFDRLGAELLAGARIPLWIVHGRDLENLELAIRGGRPVGTLVADPAPRDAAETRSTPQ